MPSAAASAALLVLVSFAATAAARQTEPDPPAAEVPAVQPWEAGAFAADPAAVLAAAASLATPEGDPEVEVLFSDNLVRIGPEGVVESRWRLVYRILGRGGIERWSSVRSHWSPWYEERPSLRARVIAPGGAVRELDPAAVAEAAVPGADPTLYEDTRLVRAPIPGVEVGAVIETEIAIQRTGTYFQAGEAQRVVLSEWAPVRHARLVVESPADAEPPLAFHHLDEPRIERADGIVRRVFEARDLPSLADAERGLPPEEANRPAVAVTTGRSWSEVAGAYRAIVEGQLAGAEAGELLDGLGEPGDERDAWLAKLLMRLHKSVRYTGVELDEARIVPRTPAETLARGFGDCKDKAVLLIAALRRAGIEAHVALLRTGPGVDVEESLPGLGMFNHAIVHLPGPEPLWIDATDPYSRPGELPPGDQDRLALVVAPGAAGLTRTPAATAADNRWIETRDYHLSELGKGRLVEVSETHGSIGRSVRAGYAGLGAAEIEERMESLIEGAYGSSELAGYELAAVDDLTMPMRTKVEADEISVAATDLEEAAAAIFSGLLFSNLPDPLTDTEADPREGDLIVHEPYSAEVLYRLHLPPGLTLRELPEDGDETLGPILYSRRYQLSEDGRTLSATLGLTFDRRRLSAEEVNAVREAVEALNERGAGQIMVLFDQSVHAHSKSGRIAEAVAEAGRLIELHPEEAVHRMQLAQVLSAAGLGEEARREAARATELEPESAPAWALLGRTLLLDEIGRLYRPGYDRAAAVEALRRAAGLDEEDVTIPADVAIALEHDERGRRYGDDAPLGEAIDVYREIADDLLGTGLEYNLPNALMHAERWEELRTEAERLEDEASKLEFGIVATAMLEGSEAAIAEADRRVAQAEARAGALANASHQLMQVRRYPGAAAMARAAARQAADAASLLSLAAVLDGMAPHEGLVADPGTPRGLILALLRVAFDAVEGTADPEALLALMAELYTEEVAAEDLEEIREEFDYEMGGGDLDMPIDLVLDLSLGAMELTSEGDDETGYKVRMTMAMGGEEDDTVFFAVREKGEMRLLATLEDPEPLGLEALRRLERGAPDPAAALLDWALESPWERGTSKDPLSGDLFPRFWPPDDAAGEAAIRRAAAVLTMGEMVTPRSLAALEEARSAAASDLEGARLDLALLAGYTEEEDREGVERTIARLGDRAAGSEAAFEQVVAALLATGGFAEVERRAGERLAAHPGDAAALRALARRAERAGDFDRAAALYDELLEHADADEDDLEAAAWLTLARGVPGEADLDRARRAAARADHEDGGSLRTLAALLAAAGRGAEAYQVLLQALEAGDGEPAAGDWLVIGLLAETYGLPEAAARLYRRAVEAAGDEPVGDDDDLGAVAPARLAERRLAVLAARSAAGGQGAAAGG